MRETISQSGIPSAAEPLPPELDLLCETCGYSLVGLGEKNRCPECGREFYPTDPPLARVPWLHRAQLGWWRGYWITVRDVLRNPRGFASEISRPVRTSAEDARSFRRWTLALATLGAIVPAFIVLTERFAQLTAGSLSPQWIASILVVGIGIGSLLTFALATDATTFLYRGTSLIGFHLRTVYHYAAAPLALMPIFTLLVIVIYAATHMVLRSMGFQFTTAVIIGLAAIQMFLSCRITAILVLHGVTKCNRVEHVTFALYLLFHWALAICLGSIAGVVATAVGFMLMTIVAG